MKMNNKNIFKVVLIVMLIGMIGTFTHCVPQIAKEIGNGGGGSSNNSSYTDNTPKDEGQIINEIQVTTGIKNHEQILHTMGAVTGIDPYSNTGIMSIYRQVELSLPTDNDIKIFSSTQQVAVTKLAAEFCFVLSNDTAKRAVIWPGQNFGGTPATSLANTSQFIDQTINAFWGPMLSDEELDIAHDDLNALISALNTAQAAPVPAPTTINTIRGVCTAALSSAYITLI
jgi:hypothetical protein